jgi:hypothetical protein
MSERKYWLDDFDNVKKLIKVFVVICAALFAIDFFYHRHVERGWEGWYGFYAFYGFFACVILVLVAKEMRKVVMRKEDYYDE